MAAKWTYDGYWLTVLGDRGAREVVAEFDLVDLPNDGNGLGLDEWLDTAEIEAWRVGGESGRVPQEWAAYHPMALAELRQAIADRDEEADS